MPIHHAIWRVGARHGYRVYEYLTLASVTLGAWLERRSAAARQTTSNNPFFASIGSTLASRPRKAR